MFLLRDEYNTFHTPCSSIMLLLPLGADSFLKEFQSKTLTWGAFSSSGPDLVDEALVMG